MNQEKLTCLLVGKTGHGKSATGNSLIGKKVFKISGNMTSETKKVKSAVTMFENIVLKVVDQPGVADTDIDEVTDMDVAINALSLTLALCDGGVDVFLLVLRFGIKLTKEEQSAFEFIKASCGDRFLDHVILVITNGDQFANVLEDEIRNITFDEWCREQKGYFRQMYTECQDRVVLINNREKDLVKMETQRRKIIELGLSVKRKHGLYTDENFKRAKSEYEKYVLQRKAPILRTEIHEKFSLLIPKLEQHSKHPCDISKENIKRDIQNLKKEIEVHDKGLGTLNDLLEMLNLAERNIDCLSKISQLAAELESLYEQKQEIEGRNGPDFRIVFVPVFGILYYFFRKLPNFLALRRVKKEIARNTELINQEHTEITQNNERILTLRQRFLQFFFPNRNLTQ